MKTNDTVVEVVLFEANPMYSKQEVQNAMASLNEIVKMYYGFLERTTASTDDGRYIDIVYWLDIKSAKEAAEELMKDQQALKAFEVIKQESLQMYHFDTFNQFEE
ncbi:hypothetical protein U6A24_12990 [Aquimarina gracilis]|uniref:Antibiotic biosynthesis monooxygenase n=1 Tax=Aquimarina gracilis TaxID=874422 RepID=A0ABU5ZWY3_9FLAO|nr:hypothetical protein [Aquimarina gracilis]MEB3346385.1 hypothetical protein [Aquimarina gracilis]